MKIISFLLLISLFVQAQDMAFEYDELKVKDSVELIDDSTAGAESVAVSNNGNLICWIAKKKDSKFLYPGEIFVKEKVQGVWQAPTRIKKGLKFQNLFSKCSFDKNDNLVVTELAHRPGAIFKTLLMKKKTGEFVPTGFVSKINIYQNNKVINSYKPKELGHSHNFEFLKHPRISPNGKWLTYYTTGMYDQKGAFLLNLETGIVTRLSSSYDKHPTWNVDGNKILFHHTPDKNHKEDSEEDSEVAYLGYFDLNLIGNTIASVERVMIDDLSVKGHVYHKHPTLVPNTNLLLFHGNTKFEGRHKLMVRKFEPNSKIHELKLELAETKIHKAKHAAAGFDGDGVYFLGKAEAEDNYKILKLSSEQILKIEKKVD